MFFIQEMKPMAVDEKTIKQLAGIGNFEFQTVDAIGSAGGQILI